eukprot:2258061-Pyramimonas_sp.AAC.1
MVTPLRNVWPCDSVEVRQDACVTVNPERRTTRAPEHCQVSSCSLGLNMNKFLARATASAPSSARLAP